MVINASVRYIIELKFFDKPLDKKADRLRHRSLQRWCFQPSHPTVQAISKEVLNIAFQNGFAQVQYLLKHQLP